MGFACDIYAYVTMEELEEVEETKRSNVLVRAIALTDEQVEKYGGMLRHLTDAERTGNSYEQYVQDAAARRAMGVTDFQADASGFSANIQLENSTLVFFSVPWDEGWTATVNGQPVQVENVSGGPVRGGVPGGAKHRAVPLPDARLCAGQGHQPLCVRRVGRIRGHGGVLLAQTEKGETAMAEHSETISGPGAGAAPAGDTAALAGAIAAKLGLATARVQAAIGLIDEGNTIPFIARYRKERPPAAWTTRSCASGGRAGLSAQAFGPERNGARRH